MNNNIYLARGAVIEFKSGAHYMLTQVKSDEYYLINIKSGNRWSELPIENIFTYSVNETNFGSVYGDIGPINVVSNNEVSVIKLSDLTSQYYTLDTVTHVYHSIDLLEPTTTEEILCDFDSEVKIDKEMLELLILKGLASGENQSILYRAKQIRDLLVDNKEKFLK